MWKDKEQIKSHYALYRIKYREKRKEAAKRYREEHKTQIATKTATWQRRQYYTRRAAGICVECGLVPPASNLTRCFPCHESMTAASRATRTKLLQEIRSHYGEVCVCCGESHHAFLTLDHINGGGNNDRILHGSGIAFYGKLRRQGFPPGFQTLCWNCNMAKWRAGACPHKT